MMKPTIHLNGSSRARLVEDYKAASTSLRGAMDLLALTGPNGRDYYPQGDDAIKEATAEHVDRLRRLAAIKGEIDEILKHLRAPNP